jgi:hypothetical protein
VQLLAPNQQGPAAIGSFQLTCLAASLGLLLLGFLYYLSYRDQIPVLLTWLGMRPHVLPTFFAPNPLSGSLPSFIHVAAFTLLTCALFRPGLPLALAAGATWLGVNILWELSCIDHQAWFDILYSHAGPTRLPLRCTYDVWDIAAAFVGAAAAPVLVLHFVRSPLDESLTDEERARWHFDELRRSSVLAASMRWAF